MYYNTTHESGERLQAYRAAAVNQEKAVLDLYSRHRELSPSQVYGLLQLLESRTLLTSVRRAVTRLTGRGWLQRTDRKVTGLYGHPEYVWQYTGFPERG